MYGAIFGDIRSHWREIDTSGICYLIDRKYKFTDRTVAMIALADALTSVEDNDSEVLEQRITESLIRWGQEYSDANYSSHFKKWLAQKEHSQISDYDNNSDAAARAVIIPYLYNDRDRIYETAELSAVITHGDVDNYNDSVLAALAVHYCMRNSGKNGAKFSFEHEIGCEMSKAISYGNVVVEAMEDFLNSTDFESAVENAIARGGDTNTRAIIVGSIAEGFYGIPTADKEYCNRLLPENMLEVLDRFDKATRRNFIKVSEAEEYLTDEIIEDALSRYNKNICSENRLNVLNRLYYGMYSGGNLRIPIVVPDRQKIYDEGKLPDDSEYLTHQTDDGKTYVVAFTNDNPEMCEKYPDIYLGTIEDVLTELADDDETSGIILNPDDDNLRFLLEKEEFEEILERTPPENKLIVFDGKIEESHADAVVTSDFEDFKNVSFENPDEMAVAHFMKKSPNRDEMHTIYTPLMFYSGTNEEIIMSCYFSCLELAKKYHLSSVAFPKQFNSPLMEKAVRAWLKMNEGCGITVFIEFGNDNSNDTDDNDRNNDDIADDNDQDCSPDAYGNEPIETNSVNKAKAEAYKNLVERAKKQYPEYRADIKPTDADKQRTRDFAATFKSKQDFWDALKAKGLTWTTTSKDNTTDMWARNALSKAIACGFDPNDDIALFAPTINSVNICNEINLYTYWQGFGYAKRTPKIKYLLVAQDWGNFIRATDDFKSLIAKMNAGEDLHYPPGEGEGTDQNLIKLFKILDRDVTKPCDDVFFTNFCLGYRLGNNAGGMTKDLMMRDADLFRELCEILQPENILCLGRLVSECVCEALAGDAFKKIFKAAKSYNDFLDNAPQIIVPCTADKKILSRVYPLAHCGFYGTKNRPLDVQRQDWQEIVDEKKIDVAIERFYQTNSPADKKRVLDEIFSRAQEDDSFIIALNEEPMQFDTFIPIFQNMKSVFLRNKHDGKYFLPAFTNLFEFAKFNEETGRKSCFMFVPAQKLLIDCMKGGGMGDDIILNPAGNQFRLTRDMIEGLYAQTSEEPEEIAMTKEEKVLLATWMASTDIWDYAVDVILDFRQMMSCELNRIWNEGLHLTLSSGEECVVYPDKNWRVPRIMFLTPHEKTLIEIKDIPHEEAEKLVVAELKHIGFVAPWVNDWEVKRILIARWGENWNQD